MLIVSSALVLAVGAGSERAGRPAVTVQQLHAAYHGPSALVGALHGGDARAGALARADLDADGAPDLVVGYAWHGAGIVTIQHGNPDAFAPKRASVLTRIQRGFDPPLVVGDARAARVPEPVSDLEVGDFNRDGRADVLAAARGGGLYLLAGDGSGGVRRAERVPLPGAVTTVAAGEFGAADGHPDIAVGVAAPRGPELLLFHGGAARAPMRFPLPGRATAVRFGSLDSDPYMDLAVAAGGRVEIVHGWRRGSAPWPASRIERLGGVSRVRGLEIGYFRRDRDGRNEIAAAFSDGTVRLLIPHDLDTRPPTAKTIRLRAAARVKATRVKPHEAESKPAWRSSTSSSWDVGPAIARGAGGALPQNLLTSGKVSLLDTDDLLVAKAAGGFDLVPASVAAGGSTKPTRKVAAAVNELNAAVDAPTAVLPMPQEANGDRDIVAVSDEGVSPTVVTLAAATLTVDRTDDPAGAALTAASACTAAPNDCSLRGAVQFANNPANAGSTIVLGANTYTLSINGDRGCVGGGEPAATGNTVGDLEINQSTTITGAGAAQTIIRQTGTGSATAPGDRVMCLNTGFLVGLQYTFSGLTITGGREGGTIGGGGIIGGELNNSVTLSGVTLSNNQDANSGLGGGGIQITGGSLTITNSLIGGSSAPCTAASPTCASGTDRNNVNLANSVQTSGGGVSYTPSSPMHTGGTGTLTVTGTTVTRNTSSGIGGGGFDMVIFAFALPGGIGSGAASISTSTISNNTATGSGGGIVVESLPTTVASSTISSNSATNGGGAYVGGGGLTLDGTSAPGVTFSGNTASGGGSTIGTTFNVTVQGTNVTLGGDVLIAGGGNWTNSPGSVISPTNVTIAGGTFNANDSTTNLSGNFAFGPTPGNEMAFPGTFNSGTGTFNFNGSGAQSITGPNSPIFNNLVVNKPSGTLTLGVNSSVKSNLTVTAGVYDLGAFTANRTAAGGALTVSNGATLKIGGTNSLPTNYATYALGATSTVEYSGSGAQTIGAANYGNLTSSSTGARTLPNGQTVGIAGAFTPGTNAYTVTGSTVNFNGSGAQTIPAFNYNNLTSSSTGARTLAASGTIGVAGTFTPGTNAYTVTGSTVNFNSTNAQTIPAFGYFSLTSSSTGARTLAGTIGVAGTFTPGANTYTIAGSTVDFNGSGAQTIPAFNYNNLTSSSTGARTLAASGTIGVAGTFTPGTNAYTIAGSTVDFNGSAAQTIPAFNYNNLTSSSTGARTLSGTIGVAGAFTPGANSYTIAGSTVDFNGSGAQTIPAFGYFSLTSSSTGARTLAASGTIGVAGLFAPGANAYTVTGSTIDFNGTATQLIPAFNYNNLTSSSTGTRTLAPSGTIGVAGSFTAGPNAYTVFGSTVDFNGSGAQTIPAFNYNNLTSSSTGARTLASSGTIGVGGAFTPGTNSYTIAGSTVDFNGSGAQTIPAFGYNNLTSSSSGARTLASSGTIGVIGLFTPGTNAYTVTGSTVSFNSSSAQTIPAFNYNNLGSSSTGARTLSGTIGVAGLFAPGANTYTVAGSTVDFNGTGAQSIPPFGYNNLTSSSTGSRTLFGTIGVAGTFTPGTNAYTVTGSTVDFNGSVAQTIPAFGYNNLTSSSTGSRTLSGLVGVAGTFTPGTNAYTVTGSTVDFNGTGAQTIAAFAYNNLTSSSTGARTLPSGQTVSVAGTFTPGTNAYTVTGSTVNFNGSGAQTVPAFAYNNLTSSSTGARTLAASGTIGVAGTFTPGTNAYTVTGSTVSFNGAGAQTVPAFTFNNLTDANTVATVSLAAATTVNGALTVNANAVLDTTTFVLTVNGAYTNNGQIRHSQSQVLSTAAGPHTFVDGVGVETARLSGLSAAFGSTTANTAAGGANPYNSCGALPPNAVRRFWQITPASAGSGQARFSFRNDEVTGGLGANQLAIFRCLPGGASWTPVGTTYTQPAPGGPAAGFSSVEATGVPFAVGGATYVVAQGTADLTVLKTNNVGGATTVGSPWTWTLHVAGGGTSAAVFSAGQTILLDNLPNSGVGYGSPSVANVGSGVTGGANISCSIAGNDLTCVANGGPVTVGASDGSFDIVLTATPTSPVTFANPRAGGSCSVDPNNAIAEGNEANNGCSNTVVVGKADTTTTITSDAPDPSRGGQAVTVAFTVVPPGSGTPTGNVQVSDGVDSCTGTVAGGSCNISLTTNGARTLTAQYVGDANFNASTSAGVAHTVDAVPPDTTIGGQPSDPSTSSSAAFTFSGTDAGTGVAGFECKLDAGSFTGCTSPKDYAGLADGSHTVQVRAIDGAGNVDASPASFTWTVDATAPATTIDSTPPNPSTSVSASFAFSGTDAGTGVASFQCKLDAGSFAACTSPKDYASLLDGSHSFQVRAIDAAGNADATPAVFTWTINTAPPDTAIDSRPANPTRSNAASFAFRGTDKGTGVASFQCSLDAGSFAACASPKSYTGLANGSHTFRVRAVGGVGNPDPSPASFTWRIDTLRPKATINQAPGQADPSRTGPIHFHVAFSEPVTGFASGDVRLSGTAGATSARVTGSGTAYDVAVSGMSRGGTVIAAIPAAAAVDAVGNGNTASTSTDNSVTFAANSPPTATVTGGRCSSATKARGVLNLRLSDADGGPLSLTLAANSNPALLPNGNVVIRGTGNRRTVKLRGAARKRGTAALRLTVSDGTVAVPITITVKVGRRKADGLRGTSGPDALFGLAGRDRLRGRGGNDLLCGGNGPDKLTGGPGRDRFSGGPGTDVATDLKPARGDKQDGTIP